MVACLASSVWKIPFHHQLMSNSLTLTRLKILEYHMSRRTFFSTCTWVCVGLDGSTCSECLPVVPCDFELPGHVPRNSARAHTCAVAFGRAPCMPWSREHESRPAVRREKMPMCKKTHLYIVISTYLVYLQQHERGATHTIQGMCVPHRLKTYTDIINTRYLPGT